MYEELGVMKDGNEIIGFFVYDKSQPLMHADLLSVDSMKRLCAGGSVNDLLFDGKDFIPTARQEISEEAKKSRKMRRTEERATNSITCFRDYVSNDCIVRKQDYEDIKSYKYGRLVYGMPRVIAGNDKGMMMFTFSLYSPDIDVRPILNSIGSDTKGQNAYFATANMNCKRYVDDIRALENIAGHYGFDGILWNLNMLDNAIDRFRFVCNALPMFRKALFQTLEPSVATIADLRNTLRGMNNYAKTDKYSDRRYD